MPRDLELKLIKGPGETINHTLLFSEGTADENLLDFALRAWVTTSQTPPGKEKFHRRDTSIKSYLNKAPAPSPRQMKPPVDPYQ